jgi:hypothetical protein
MATPQEELMNENQLLLALERSIFDLVSNSNPDRKTEAANNPGVTLCRAFAKSKRYGVAAG